VALDLETWVLDGNYTRTIPIKWKHVDTIIWIDTPFLRNMWQSITRAIYRAYTQTELWEGTGNRESFRKMFSRDSIIWWAMKVHHRTRRKYTAAMESEQYAHLSFIRLRLRNACEDFLRELEHERSTAQSG
jgi:hypothetical protein